MPELSTLREVLKGAPVSKGVARKREITPEQLAQEPVYMRFTKAEMECLEEYMWANDLLPKGQHLQPRVLTHYTKHIFGKFGVDWEKVRKTLARPEVIRR